MYVPGTIGCASCHTSGSPTSVDCTVCHDAGDQSLRHYALVGPEPNGATPLWSGIGPAPGGGSANCLLCHARGALPRVATHAQSAAQPAGFPIAAGVHFQSCEQCHTTTTTDPSLTNPQLDFTTANCANCHSQARDLIDAKHAWFGIDLTNPAATTATCLGCHASGQTVAGFVHGEFPVAAGDVHAVGAPMVLVPEGVITCGSCHTPATNADYRKVDCTICHTADWTAPWHSAVSDLPETYPSPDAPDFAITTLCLQCHADSQVPTAIETAVSHDPPIAPHTPFGLASGAPHYRKSCLECHVTARTDKPWATDFTALPRHCTGCHTEPVTSANHLGTSWPGYPGTYTYADNACIQCHATGDIGPFVHANFPITADPVHRSGAVPCLGCHANTSRMTDITTITCTGCHNNGATAVDPGGVDSRHMTPVTPLNVAGYAFANASCLKCHAGTIATPSWTNPLKMPLLLHSGLCFNVTSGEILDHYVDRTVGSQPICFVCHNKMNTAAQPWGVDWTVANCGAPCHSPAKIPPTCQ
jgi:hypothetical protein